MSTEERDQFLRGMTSNQAAAGNTMELGGEARNRGGGQRTPHSNLQGKKDDLDNLMYVFNRKNQGEMYLKTTAAIAEKVGQDYSKDMKMLVKYGQVPDVTDPTAPQGNLSNVEMKRWEAKLESHEARVQKIGKHKSMVSGLIYLKCSEVIQKNLERDKEYARMELEDDVVGLLKKLKA